MKMNSHSLSLILSSALLLTACTEPGETTSIGAATGGVIGAGLGAIVGNQTGDAGSGLVIGSIAGAGAGAAIGNALEAQNKAIRTQDEALERQQKMLAAQNAEIRELRNMPRDTASAMRGAFNEESRNVGKQATRPMGRPLTADDLNRGMGDTNTSSGTTNGSSFTQSEESPRAALRPQATETESFRSPEIKERSLVSEVKIEEPQAEIVAKVMEPTSGMRSAECEKADSEAEKASSSKEPADKLFYLRRAIRLCPNQASFHNQLADEYAQLGRNEDAKASYEDAIRLDPSMNMAKKGMAALSENAY